MKKLRERTWSDITNRVPEGEHLDSTELRPEMIKDYWSMFLSHKFCIKETIQTNVLDKSKYLNSLSLPLGQ